MRLRSTQIGLAYWLSIGYGVRVGFYYIFTIYDTVDCVIEKIFCISLSIIIERIFWEYSMKDQSMF